MAIDATATHAAHMAPDTGARIMAQATKSTRRTAAPARKAATPAGAIETATPATPAAKAATPVKVIVPMFTGEMAKAVTREDVKGVVTGSTEVTEAFNAFATREHNGKVAVSLRALQRDGNVESLAVPWNPKLDGAGTVCRNLTQVIAVYLGIREAVRQRDGSTVEQYTTTPAAIESVDRIAATRAVLTRASDAWLRRHNYSLRDEAAIAARRQEGSTAAPDAETGNGAGDGEGAKSRLQLQIPGAGPNGGVYTKVAAGELTDEEIEKFTDAFLLRTSTDTARRFAASIMARVTRQGRKTA